jgi:hypothetical protein
MNNQQLSETLLGLFSVAFFLLLFALAGTGYGGWIVLRAIRNLLIKLERRGYDLSAHSLTLKENLKRELWLGAKVYLVSLGVAGVTLSAFFAIIYSMMNDFSSAAKKPPMIPDWVMLYSGIAFGVAMSLFAVTQILAVARQFRDTSNIIPSELYNPPE